MGYRDDSEALRSRVQELETELTAAKTTIARMRGEDADPVADTSVDWFSGTPRSYEITRAVDFELTDEGYERIAKVLLKVYPAGQVSQVGRVLTLRWGTHEIRVARENDGRTTLRGTRHRLPLVSVGMVVIAIGLGLLPTMGIAGAMMAAGLSSAVFAAMLPLLFVVALLASRRLVGRNDLRERTALAGALESAIAVAEAHPRARIAATAESVVDEVEEEDVVLAAARR